MLCYKLSDELATFAMIKYVSGEEELVGLHNCSRHVHFSNSLPDWQKSFLNFHLTIPTLICIGLCFFFLPDFGKSVVFFTTQIQGSSKGNTLLYKSFLMLCRYVTPLMQLDSHEYTVLCEGEILDFKSNSIFVIFL